MYVTEFYVPVDYVISENSMYKPAFKHRHCFLYLDPVVGEYKKHIISHVKNNYDISQLPESATGVVSEYKFFMNKESFWTRDVTNAVKPVEDAFFSVFRELRPNMDDAMVISNIAIKVASDTPGIFARFAFLNYIEQNNYIISHSLFNLCLGDFNYE